MKQMSGSLTCAHGTHGAEHHTPTPGGHLEYERALSGAEPAPGKRVVRVALDARQADWEFVAGKRTTVWTYNGQVPGPVIEANVGDVLEIRLTNSLPESTTIHWHGLRLPAAMDGTENVQHPVSPGETFTYRFALPDAGTFWYHPHSNETVQMERGLYGALIVHGDEEPQLDRERVLVLDDVALDRKGRIKPRGSFVERHDGRLGSTLLINGKERPELALAAGQIERWRVVNASSARYVKLSIGGRPFRLLGTDGGLIAAPVTLDEVLLAPADRVDLAVGPFTEGDTLAIEGLPYVQGSVARPRRLSYGRIRVGAPASSQAFVPQRLRDITPLVTGPVTSNRTIHLGFAMTLRRGVDFTINGELHHQADPVRVGDLQVWDIVNHTMMDHPFHLHGFFFQVVEVNGARPPFLSWEDTVTIPPSGRVRIAWMPDDRPGEWMYHCHILEHHDGGMMAHFRVVEGEGR